MWGVADLQIHCNVTKDMIGFSCVYVLSVLPQLVLEPYMYTCIHVHTHEVRIMHV